MATPLRDYQIDLIAGVRAAWDSGARNVLAVLPTGGGKTVVTASLLAEFEAPSVVIAHRQELVAQASLALARNGLRHRVIAPPAVRSTIEALHMMEFGRRWVDQGAQCAVAGVATLARAKPELLRWLSRVGLWVLDEAAHLTLGSVWHKAVELMPQARGLGVTATPGRLDGKGLGRHADGVFDALVQGVSMRELIDRGHLSRYRIFAPGRVDLSRVHLSAGGDYRPDELSRTMREARITGDVVLQYLRHAAGRRGITFAVDVEAAREIAAAYRQWGVPAAAADGSMPDLDRVRLMRKFRAGEILQLVNCELYGEGLDVPACEVVSLVRPTMSLGLHLQQVGRGLRVAPGKSACVLLRQI